MSDSLPLPFPKSSASPRDPIRDREENLYNLCLLRMITYGGKPLDSAANQATIRELLAVALAILPVCGPSFPVTPDDIRSKARHFHRRNDHREHLFGEFALVDENGKERILLLHVDFSTFFGLYIYEEDCHEVMCPGIPVTYAGHLATLPVSKPAHRNDLIIPDSKPKSGNRVLLYGWEEVREELGLGPLAPGESIPTL